MLIIDEADRMMDMGFLPDVQDIVSRLSHKRQTLLFSATMPPAIKKLSKTLLSNPTEIMVSPPAETAKTIKQYQVKTTSKNKAQKLRSLLSEKSFETVIVFLNRKRTATTLCTSLLKDKLPVGLLHGDLTQTMRTNTLSSFKKGEILVLIASDVAARGIDIENLDCVINYDVPINPEDYVHRIGRTGRAGKSGTAITFVSQEDQNAWNQIQTLIKDNVTEYPSLKETPKTQQSTKKQSAQQKQPIHKTPAKANHTTPGLPKDTIQGFGEHIPAFMQKSSPSPS